jgi:ParB family chromosome partitioning protein
LEELALDAIEPNPRQPREHFDEEALSELVASIRAVGVLQPVVVRELEHGRYQLVMGERRWRAARAAELGSVPAIVRETPDDELLRDALLENLHRQALNPLEEAAAYQQLLEEFGATHEQLAERIARSRSHVTNTLRLLKLPASVQRKLAAGVLSAGHARALLGLDDRDAQERLAERIVAEGLSVRSVEEIVAVGEQPARPSGRRGRAPHAPGLAGLAARLSDLLETRVRVDLGRRRGKIVVDFASVDDLERIVRHLAPDALDALGAVRAADAQAPAEPGAAEVSTSSGQRPDGDGGHHHEGDGGHHQEGDGGHHQDGERQESNERHHQDGDRHEGGEWHHQESPAW